MKISLVCMPATSTPARYIPFRSLSSVSGLITLLEGFAEQGLDLPKIQWIEA
jgi:hypothetical protein